MYGPVGSRRRSNRYENTARPLASVVPACVTTTPPGLVMVNVTAAPATGAPPPVTVAFTVAVWLRDYLAAPGAAVTPSLETMTYDAEPDPEDDGLDAFVAETPTL